MNVFFALFIIISYKNENIDITQRLCNVCNVVEDETHVILDCSAYDPLRNNLFSILITVLPSFMDLDSIEKMKFLFTYLDMTRTCVKTCFKSCNIEILSFINNSIYKQIRLSLFMINLVFEVFDQVGHKQGCTATEDGLRLENFGLMNLK